MQINLIYSKYEINRFWPDILKLNWSLKGLSEYFIQVSD